MKGKPHAVQADFIREVRTLRCGEGAAIVADLLESGPSLSLASMPLPKALGAVRGLNAKDALYQAGVLEPREVGALADSERVRVARELRKAA